MYFINVFPLEEQYATNSTKLGELIIDPRTGHIIVNDKNSSYSPKSITKDIEAELDSLISFKDRLYKEYMSISDSLEDAVNKLTLSRENIQNINTGIAENNSKLIELNSLADNLLTVYDHQYKRYNKFMYDEMESFRVLVRENVKKVIVIDNIIDEIKLLITDIESMKKVNDETLKIIKKKIGM